MIFRNVRLAIVTVVFCCCLVIPVSSVVLEVTVKGSVATMTPAKNSITLDTPSQYGCTYPGLRYPVCTYTPMSTSALTGTVPDVSAFSIFRTGDPVVATSLGGAGETWITLAKLFGSRPNEEYVTDIAGDPTTIPTPLVGNYALDIATIPDCTKCQGTVCTAKSAAVKVTSEGKEVTSQNLLTGSSLFYNGRNDGSSISVTFNHGQAGSSACPGSQAGVIGGVQPVNDFVVKIVPPIGMAQNNIRTATTTRPDEALTGTPAITTPVTGTVNPAVSATPAPTKSGGLPLAVIGALSVVFAIITLRSKNS